MRNTEQNINKNKENEAVSFEEALSHTGYGKFNVFVLILSGSSLTSVIIETTNMSFVLPAAHCDFHLTLSDKNILSAISFLGVCSSSLLWGFIGDTRGRRKVILITMFISCFMAIASSLAPYIWMFIVFRYLNGFFIGGPSAVIYAYLSEFHSDKYRQRVVSCSGAFISLGTMYLAGISWMILPLDFNIHIPGLNIYWTSWRLLLLICSVPSFVVASCLLFMPESPKYLWNSGKSEEALKVLRRIYASNTGEPETNYPVNNLLVSDELINDTEDLYSKSDKKTILMLKKMLRTISALFFKPFVYNTLKLSIIQFGAFASSTGFIMWLPDILNKMNLYLLDHADNTATVCEILNFNKNVSHSEFRSQMPATDCNDNVNEDVFSITLILGTFFTFSYILNTCVINLVGKKLLLIILLSFSGICGLIINLMTNYITIVILSALFLIAGTIVNLTNTILVDLYPTQFRALAVAITLMAGRLGAVTASHTMGLLLENNCPVAFFLFAGQHSILLVAAFLIPIPLFVNKSKKPT